MTRLALVSAVLLLSGCGGGPSSNALPDVQLPSLSKGLGPSLSSCPAAKCLTVYVAPWCGYCRMATPLILATREWLKSRGVETRVVVGMDDPRPVQEYAADFGPATLLDLNGAIKTGGVPSFFVSDASGKVLRKLQGLPQVGSPADLAGALGLP